MIRAHAGNARKQEELCATLTSVMARRKMSVDVQNEVVKEGGAETVVAVLFAHARDAGVQTTYCRALVAMTLGNADNRIAVGAAGGVEAAVVAVSAPIFEVTDAALRALQELTLHNPTNATRAKVAGIMDAVRAVEPRYLKDENTLKETLQAGRLLDTAGKTLHNISMALAASDVEGCMP
jgi:hypothetical protein